MHSEKEKSFLQGVYKAAGLGQGDPKGWSAFRPQCRDWSLGPHTNTIISPWELKKPSLAILPLKLKRLTFASSFPSLLEPGSECAD